MLIQHHNDVCFYDTLKVDLWLLRISIFSWRCRVILWSFCCILCRVGRLISPGLVILSGLGFDCTPFRNLKSVKYLLLIDYFYDRADERFFVYLECLFETYFKLMVCTSHSSLTLRCLSLILYTSPSHTLTFPPLLSLALSYSHSPSLTRTLPLLPFLPLPHSSSPSLSLFPLLFLSLTLSLPYSPSPFLRLPLSYSNPL